VEAEALGGSVGLFFWLAVAAAGVVKCVQISRRPATSTLCVTSLLLMLVGLAVMILETLLRKTMGLQVWILIPVLAAYFICLVSAFILAIIGLVDYGRHPEYNQGQRQAIATLVLGGLFLLVLIGSFSAGLQKGFRKRKGAATAVPVEEALRFEELNFQVKGPRKPWVRIDAESLNPNATLALMRTNPQVFFMVIAEDLGDDPSFTTEDLVKISQGALRSGATVCEIGEAEVYPVKGMEGIRFFSDATVRNFEATYTHWIWSHNGYFYQLVTFGGQEDRKTVRESAEYLLERFSQIEPLRISAVEASEPFEAYESEAFGYSVRFDGTSWREYPSLRGTYPSAETGALRGADGGFILIPLCLGKRDPHPDAIRAAFVAAVNLDTVGDSLTVPRAFPFPGMEAAISTVEEVIEGETYFNRFITMRRRDAAFLVLVWGGDAGTAEALSDEVFAALSFSRPPVPSEEPSGLPAAIHAGQGDLYNEIGIFYYEAKAYEKGIPYFLAAVSLNPESETYLTNALGTFSPLFQYDEALALLESERHPRADRPRVLSWKAFFLKQVGRSEEALAVYRTLFAGDYVDDEDFTFYIDLLKEARAWKEADAAFEAYETKSRSPDLWLERVDLLHQRGEYEGAVEILKARRKKFPRDTDLAYELIRNYNELGRYAEVLAVCDRLIGDGYESALCYYLKGQAEFDLKWYRRAKESFESAHRMSPSDKEILSRIEAVAGMLGEGTNTPVKEPLPAVPLPRKVSSRLPTLSSPSPVDGYGAFYLSRVEGFAFEKGKPFRHTTYERIKILDAAGISRFSTVSYAYDPLGERIFMNRLLVRDPRGEVVSRGAVSDCYVLDERGNGMATHDKVLQIPIPGLRPGYVIELAVTVETLGTVEAFPFNRCTLTTTLPICFAAAVVLADPDALRFEQSRVPGPSPVDGGLAWIVEGPPFYVWEPEQAPYHSYLPTVRIGSSEGDWKRVGDDYISRIEPFLESEESVLAHAGGLLRGLTTPEEKVDAICGHVQGDYVYKAIEFGRRAQIPLAASQTLRNRYGDCKDLSVLLHHLLKAAGVPSNLVLADTGFPVDPSICSLDQFNHMIVHLPTVDGGIFVDPTDQGIAPRIGVPCLLGGNHGLLLAKGASRIVTIPTYPEGRSGVEIRRRISVEKEKDLLVEERVALSGYVASFYRNTLRAVDPARHLAWGQEVLLDEKDAGDLESMEVENLANTRKELVIEVRYRLPSRCSSHEGRLAATLPAAWERNQVAVLPAKDRKSPWRIQFPYTLHSETVFHIPAGWRVEEDGGRPERDGTSYLTWTTITSHARDSYSVTLSLKRMPCQLGPAEYPAYFDQAKRATESVGREIRLRRQ